MRRWTWVEAWVYAFVAFAGFVISRALAATRHPDLLKERARLLQPEDAKAWDKILSPLVGLGGGLIPLVAGLDALFGWSGSFSLPLKVLALVVILLGYVLDPTPCSQTASFPEWSAFRRSVVITSFPAAPTAGCAIPGTQGR